MSDRARTAASPGTPGVLMVNLGSPAAPTPAALRRYLREFLSDPHVVDLPPLLWRPVLELAVLPRRAPRSAALYRRVWTDEGPPLLAISRRQRAALAERLAGEAVVALGMRYGRPSIRDALEELRAHGVQRIALLPMFPQYAGATVGTVREHTGRQLRALGWAPPLVTVPPYFDDRGYIAALAEGVERAAADGVDHHVFSFHGLPERQVRRGDPYPQHCAATARALAAQLGLRDDEWTLVYQSRFGPQPWLRPYADELVPRLAARHPRLVVACPGFTADCLETIDEIGHVLREAFLAAGGTELRLARCLDDAPRWIDALADLVRRALGAGAPS